MPEIDVELIGPLRRPWPESRRRVTVPDGASPAALLTQLGYSEREAAHLTVRVNGARAARRAVLGQGDRVEVILVVGGG